MPIALRLLKPASDAAALHAIFGDDAQCKYLIEGACKTVDDTQALLERYQAGSSPTTWAILDEEDNAVCGRVTMFTKDEGWTMGAGYQAGKAWELGIMICPPYQGLSIAYDACTQAIDIIDNFAKPRRIISDIDPDNTPSIRLMERLGMRYEGTLRKAWHTHIGVRDTYLMSLIDTDPRPWRS